MSLRRCVLGVSALTVLTAWLPHEAAAQGILDRVKKLAHNTATAGKTAVVNEANGEINSAVQDAAAENVADGSFIAVLSPWSSTGVAKRVEIARFSGEAFVLTTPNSRQIMLCDDKSAQSWLASFAIQKKAPVNGAIAGAPPGANAHAGTTAHGATPHAGAGAGGAGGAHGGATSASSGGAHGAGSAAHGGSAPLDSSESKSGSAGKSAPNPFTATDESFSFPSTQVTVTVPAAGATSGKPSRGSLTVTDLSQTILGGAGKIRFSQATIPGEKGPQVVDMGVTFKARVMAPGDAPVGCGTGAAKATTGAKAPGGASPPLAAPTPGATFAEGDVLLPKIGNVKLLAASNDGATVLATVNLGDALVYLGQEENGYVHVQGSAGEGWVRRALLNKR